MADVSHTISSLLNGVSQQPAIARLASQLEAQEDCFSSLVEGLTRRPPLEHLAKLATAGATLLYNNALVHSVNRDNIERYTVVIRNGDIEVFDTLTGAAKTVNKPNGVGYLSALNPQQDFRVLTVSDYTFIVNRTVTTAMTGELAVSGTLASVVNKLSDLSATGPGAGAEYPHNYFQVGNNPDPATGSSVVYYVAWFKVRTLGSDAAGGYWAEVAKTATPIAFNPATMPHVLTSNGDGTFTFRQVAWPKRVAGDATVMPAPSFIGKKINDVYFARRRLGFVAGTTLHASAGGGDYFNFWRARQSQVTAVDPIDINSEDEHAAGGFHAATAFNNDVVFWSAQAQFRLASTEATLTPNNIDVRKVSRYDNSSGVRPVSHGDGLFFAVERGNWAQFLEFVLQADLKTATAPSVSDHIPKYVPSGVTRMVASTQARTLFVRSINDADSVYLWTHMEQDRQRQQSSWSRWNLPSGCTLLDISVDQWLLVVAYRTSEGVFLGSYDCAPWVQSNRSFYRVHLDRALKTVVPVYVPVDNRTTFTVPYALDAGEKLYAVPVVADPTQGVPEPQELTRIDTYNWFLPGNVASTQFDIGVLFKSWCELSELFPPRADAAASGDKAITDEGRLTLQAVLYSLDQTSALSADTWEKVDEAGFGLEGGITLAGTGTPETLSAPGLPATVLCKFAGRQDPTRRKAARVRQPIHKKSERAIIRFGSVDHRPFAILSARWHGVYNYTRRQV